MWKWIRPDTVLDAAHSGGSPDESGSMFQAVLVANKAREELNRYNYPIRKVKCMCEHVLCYNQLWRPSGWNFKIFARRSLPTLYCSKKEIAVVVARRMSKRSVIQAQSA